MIELVDVYGKPGFGCPQCVAVKRLFDREGVDYRFHDVTEDREALDFCLKAGFQGVPVVVCRGEAFQGYHLDKLRLVVGGVKAAVAA